MPGQFELSQLKIAPESPVARLVAETSGIQCVRFTDGEYLVEEGGHGRDTYLVLQGSFVVEQGKAAGTGQNAPLAVSNVSVDDPNFIGEMAYLGDTLRTASVRASGAVYCLCLQPEHVDRAINEFPEFARTLCRQFAGRLKEANEQIKHFRGVLDMKTERLFVQSGERLVSAGDPADRLLQLVDGTLVRKSQDGPEQIRPAGGEPAFIDAEAYFRGRTHPDDIEAESMSILIAIDRDSRLAAIRNYPELADQLLAGE